MNEVKEQLERNITESFVKKKQKPEPKNGRGFRVGGQRPQYNGTDAVNCQQVTAHVGYDLFTHIKFLERGQNENNQKNDSVCDKMMSKTGIYVSCCIEESWYWENTIAGMFHIKNRILKCNFHNALWKAFK